MDEMAKMGEPDVEMYASEARGGCAHCSVGRTSPRGAALLAAWAMVALGAALRRWRRDRHE